MPFHFCPHEAAAIAAALPFLSYVLLWFRVRLFGRKEVSCPSPSSCPTTSSPPGSPSTPPSSCEEEDTVCSSGESTVVAFPSRSSSETSESPSPKTT